MAVRGSVHRRGDDVGKENCDEAQKETWQKMEEKDNHERLY